MSMRDPLPSGRSAFTLIELIVGMALLAMLLVMLLSIVDGAVKLWTSNENRVDSYREARAAINVISADLNSVVASTNTNYFSYNRTDKLPSSAVPPAKAGNMFFVSAQPKESQDADPASDKPANTSDLCVVGYFLAYDKVSTGSSVSSLNLYRYFLSSGAAFDSLRKGTLLQETLSTTPTSTSPTGTEVLARNITDFKIEAFTVDPGADSAGNIRKFQQTDQTPMPDFVDVELTALSNDSVKRFHKKEDWSDKSSATYKAGARTFKTRIHLRAEAVGATPTPTPTPAPL
jgi:prepilin-type N-terminal cleavage/methylation domain-containing protein